MKPSPPEAANAPRAKWSAARAAHAVHSAVGLWFTVLLTVVMCSGTLAVFAPEIDRLVFPQLRSAPPAPGAEKINPGALYDAVAEAYPGMGITYLDTAANDKYASATTTVLLPNSNKRTVAIDSYTGRVLGEVPAVTVRGFFAHMHAVLFQGLPGFYVVNFCGVLVLAAIVSGLIAHRQFWRGFFKRPRFGRSGRILLGDMHRLISLWLLGFLLVIGATGTWYFYNFPLTHLGLVPELVGDQPAPPTLTDDDLDALGPETPTLPSGARIVAAVKNAYPDMAVTGLMPPLNMNMPFVVYGERGEYLHGKDPNAVYVNPYTGHIMGAALSEDLTLNQFVFQALSQLHHGELIPARWGHAAKTAMKGIWFLCGAGASFLAISGLLVHLKRTRQAMAASRWRRVPHWLKPWTGPMWIFKYINVLIVLSLVMGVSFLPKLGQQRPAPATVAFPAQPAGPLSISLALAPGPGTAGSGLLQPGAKVLAFPRISDGRFRDARAIVVGLSQGNESSTRSGRVKGAEHLASAAVRLPEQFEGAQLWVEVKMWDGTVHRAQWPLSAGSKTNPS